MPPERIWLATSSGILRLPVAEFDRAIATPDYVMHFRVWDTSDGLAGYPVPLGDRHAVRAQTVRAGLTALCEALEDRDS